MNRSSNEVMTLAAKAARGAGAPPAQAAAFGATVVRHLCAGRDAGDIRDALDALPEGPIMTLPLAFQRALENDGSATFERHVALAQSHAEALPFGHDCKVGTGALTICLDPLTPAPGHPPQRLTLDAALADRLTALAARTFVPETESSRQSGAGAGLTDND